jgi:hypothetical protein
MFGRKETTAEKVADQLELIKKVRAANSVWENPWGKITNIGDFAAATFSSAFFSTAFTVFAVGFSSIAEQVGRDFGVLESDQRPLTVLSLTAGAILSPLFAMPITAGQAAVNLGLAGATAAVVGGLFKKARRKNGLLDPQELSTALANFYLSSDSAGDNTKFVEAGRQVIRDLFNVTGDNTIAELVRSAKSIRAFSLSKDLAPPNPEYLRLAEQIRIATVNALTCLPHLESQVLSSFLKDIVGKDAAGYRNMVLEFAENIPEVDKWLSVNLSANNSETWSSIKKAIQQSKPLSDAQRTCLLMLTTQEGLQYSPDLAIKLLELPVISTIAAAIAANRQR